jgi:Arc/MetJ-type ribon-helix-helix transcriptional regulator
LTVSVRLPSVLEEDLAQYCASRGLTRSDAIKQAISRLVAAERDAPSAYDLGRDLFDPKTDALQKDDVAANSKRLLRGRFRK